MIQYWHVFSFNDYKHHECIAVCKDQHSGDWDAMIQVQLDSTLQPEGVWFSRHTHDYSDGIPFDFLDKSQVHWLRGTHPLVTIDAGGHAAYASPADFCSYYVQFAGFQVNAGRAAWSDDGSPSDLHQIECNGDHTPQTLSTDPSVGGTVWDTSSSGKVVQGSVLNGRRISGPVPLTGTVGGRLVLLGQYNPGTEDCGSACAGIGSGQFSPLNEQDFIGFSGFWGNPSPNGAGFPPRGPVFQGYDSQTTHTYHAWYNNASPYLWEASDSLYRTCGITGLTAPCSSGSQVVLGLGDSVAAGYGLGPAEGSPDNNNAYPYLLANEMNPTGPVPGYDYAVEGACTIRPTTGGCAGHSSVADQISSAKAANINPTLVTLTVGANDINFAGCLPAYLSAAVGLGGSPCSASQLQTDLSAFKINLDQDIKAIQSDFPSARIILTEYYNPFPAPVTDPSMACYLDSWIVAGALAVQSGPLSLLSIFTTKSSEFLQEVVSAQTAIYTYVQNTLSLLNAAISTVGVADGATTVQLSTTDAITGAHDMCAADNNPYVYAPLAQVRLKLGPLQILNYSNPGPTCPSSVDDPKLSTRLPIMSSARSPIGRLSVFVNFAINCMPHPTPAGQQNIANTIRQHL